MLRGNSGDFLSMTIAIRQPAHTIGELAVLSIFARILTDQFAPKYRKPL